MCLEHVRAADVAGRKVERREECAALGRRIEKGGPPKVSLTMKVCP